MNVNFYAQNLNSRPYFTGIRAFKTPLTGKEVNKLLKSFEMNVYNPYSRTFCYEKINIDLSKAQDISLKKYRDKSLRDDPLRLNYNPNRYGFIKDKKNNTPVKTMILTSQDNYHPEDVGFHFLSEDLEAEYGYVYLSKKMKRTLYDTILDSEIMEDYHDLGIVGPRVIVKYLQNWNDKKHGGIGKLADMLAVKYCIDSQIKPVIVSLADKGSPVAHYLRGKRFLPLEKDSFEYTNFKKIYGTADPNIVMEQMIKTSAEKIQVDNCWNLLGMYMPKEIIEKYSKML